MDLKAKAIKSTAWYVATRLWIQLFSWLVTVVLARILTPADYGLFAMAFTIITFLELFQEFGLGVSIVQRQDLTKPQINAIFWIISLASLGLVVVAFLGANAAVEFYREPRLGWMIRMLCVSFMFTSLRLVPYSLLTKEIDFKHRSLAEAYGVVAGGCVSLGVAYMGHGVWALVFGYLVRAAVRNSVMLLSCGWFPGFKVSLSNMGEILRFGLNVAGAGGLVTLSGIINNGVIGRVLGGYDLGLYAMATALGTNSPLHKLSTGVINQLSLPVFAKLQKNDNELRNYFLKIAKYVAVVALPMQVGMALVAGDFVILVLSEKWLASVALIEIFSLGGVFDLLQL